jgi:uncharacterized membrane protein
MSGQRQQRRDICSDPPDPEHGQITVLTIGYVLLALLLTSVVMAVSTVYIEHKKLLSMADGASVAAADSYSLGQMETKAGTPSAVLNGGRVRTVVTDYLTQNDAFTRFEGLAIEPSTGSADGSTAVVVLSAAVHPPIVNFLVPDGIAIRAESTARARLAR